jgi:hypothetical protein
MALAGIARIYRVVADMVFPSARLSPVGIARSSVGFEQREYVLAAQPKDGVRIGGDGARGEGSGNDGVEGIYQLGGDVQGGPRQGTYRDDPEFWSIIKKARYFADYLKGLAEQANRPTGNPLELGPSRPARRKVRYD